MANTGMRALRERKRRMNDEIEEKRRNEAHDDPQPEDENNESEEQDVPEHDERQGDPQHEDSHDNADDDVDLNERFTRLQSKASKLEKGKSELERKYLQSENERYDMQRQLVELKAQLHEKANKPEQEKPNHEPERDIEQELIAEMGQEAWDYLDDPQRKAFIAMAKKTQKAAPAGQPVDVESTIQNALQENEQKRQTQLFIKNLNADLKPLGVNFVTLANSDDFEDWLKADRNRAAIFETAAQYRDEKARKDIVKLVSDYKGVANAPNNNTPATRKPGRPAKPKTNEVTYEQYQQAIKDKRHANRRKAANKVIAAWHKQQEN